MEGGPRSIAFFNIDNIALISQEKKRNSCAGLFVLHISENKMDG